MLGVEGGARNPESGLIYTYIYIYIRNALLRLEVKPEGKKKTETAQVSSLGPHSHGSHRG